MFRPVALFLLFALTTLLQAASPSYYMYVGTYTNGTKSGGIYLYRFDSQTGKFTPLGLAVESVDPSFLAVHPNNRFLYAANESENKVSAFSIAKDTGQLTLINQKFTQGHGPCFVAVDKTGENVLAADYGDGTVAVLPIRDDGELAEVSSFQQHTGKGADPQRQAGPHAHSANLSPDNKFVVVPDLGLDKLMMYRFDAKESTLTPANPPFVQLAPASGPRHFVFHPNDRNAYSINEIASTISAFAYNASNGTLTELQTISTLPEGADRAKNTTAEILLSPNGRFLYGSNRGHDSIAVFRVDLGNGRLTPVETVPTGGKMPRNFRIDPTGKFLLAENQKSDSIVIFAIDQKTGKLTATGEKLDVASPVCIRFVPITK